MRRCATRDKRSSRKLERIAAPDAPELFAHADRAYELGIMHAAPRTLPRGRGIEYMPILAAVCRLGVYGGVPGVLRPEHLRSAFGATI
jgi:hypothetical protein